MLRVIEEVMELSNEMGIEGYRLSGSLESPIIQESVIIMQYEITTNSYSDKDRA